MLLWMSFFKVVSTFCGLLHRNFHRSLSSYILSFETSLQSVTQQSYELGQCWLLFNSCYYFLLNPFPCWRIVGGVKVSCYRLLRNPKCGNAGPLYSLLQRWLEFLGFSWGWYAIASYPSEFWCSHIHDHASVGLKWHRTLDHCSITIFSVTMGLKQGELNVVK